MDGPLFQQTAHTDGRMDGCRDGWNGDVVPTSCGVGKIYVWYVCIVAIGCIYLA